MIKERMTSTKQVFRVHPPAVPSLARRSPLKKPCFFSLRDWGSSRQIKQGMMQELLTGKTRLIQGSEVR